MGLFKQMKQMKQVVAETPETIRNAQAMQRAAQAQAQAQAGAMAAPQPAAAGSGAELDAMEMGGLALRPYAEICRAANDRGITDQDGIASVAAEHGVDRTTWDTATQAWTPQFSANPAVAKRFNSIWRGVA